MKLLLIRHGDPDYTIDSLTEKGHREAQLLAEKMKNVPVKDFYVSPLGRARATADYTLKKVGRKATVLDWMEEFPAFLNPQESQGLKNAYGTHKNNQNRVIWDMMPEYWTNHPEFCTKDGWRSTEAAQMSNMPALYDRVAKGLDELLASHGYHREGNMYRTEKGNEDTIALYCHFGVSCVMLSYLWGISPFILWHSLMMAPTSVTELVTEEREEGKVFFRATRIGDISHLYAGSEEPAFAGRFCETYDKWEERH